MLARRRALRAAGGALAGVLVGGLAAGSGAAGRRLRFVVTDVERGRVVLSAPVAVGDHLTLRYTHSVSKRPVEEEFAVAAPGRLAMDEMRFDTFGANLPVGPERIGSTTTTFLREEDGYRVLHHGRVLGEVQLMVNSSRSGQVLTLPGGRRVRLLDVAEYGTRLEWSVEGGPRSLP
ncbi:DUF1850 domain-containing protein [Streptomonospora litoralis]|uniref:DUF1850 domain-containing protein n=1 Tax=Streptomonospora litoralis TaxID=2498135 RepID=A0A4P6PYB5_9ACTN|nr:DUF1850 domain-containing protein [Streptomonospora litoralis]QBI53276.1 hypothetical protein EKD16_07400 [Streptomonospora litoralis]